MALIGAGDLAVPATVQIKDLNQAHLPLASRTLESQLSNKFVIRNSVFPKRTPRFSQSAPRFTQKEAFVWLS